MGEDYTQQVAGENPPTPGSGPSSPSSVEPGASESAQSAASLSPPSVARTNTTAGSGAGETAGPERKQQRRTRAHLLRELKRVLAHPGIRQYRHSLADRMIAQARREGNEPRALVSLT